MKQHPEHAGLRLLTFRDAGGERVGVERNGRLLDLTRAAALTGQTAAHDEQHTMLGLIAGGARALERVRALVASAPDARRATAGGRRDPRAYSPAAQEYLLPRAQLRRACRRVAARHWR